MVSKFIINTIKKLAKEFSFYNLQTKLTPFVHVVYVTTENVYTDVSVSLFFHQPNTTIWSELRGQDLAKVTRERSYRLISQPPSMGSKSSQSDSMGKTTALKLSDNELLIVTVITSSDNDQSLITDSIIKALTN